MPWNRSHVFLSCPKVPLTKPSRNRDRHLKERKPPLRLGGIVLLKLYNYRYYELIYLSLYRSINQPICLFINLAIYISICIYRPIFSILRWWGAIVLNMKPLWMAWRWTVSPMWWTSRPRTKLDDSGNAPRAGMMTWFRKQSRIKTETHAEIGCSVTAMATVNAFSRSQVLGDPESWGFRVRSIFAREIWEATGSICFNIIHYKIIYIYIYICTLYV